MTEQQKDNLLIINTIIAHDFSAYNIIYRNGIRLDVNLIKATHKHLFGGGGNENTIHLYTIDIDI